MSTPSVTLRSVKNTDTGIDISVPRFQEEEAPLGGISILYEISVLTTLDLFKTRLHRGEDVVHFSIFKAYREIEDLSNKLNKKYPKAGLPPVPKASSADKFTNEEKVEALDIFISAVAKNIEICHCSIFTQFIGINSQRLPSFNVPITHDDVTSDSSPTAVQVDAVADKEVFPKMKNVEKSQMKFVDSPPLKTKVDLFEEVKSTGENKLNRMNNSDRTTSPGLFDDFEEDSLFSSKPSEKKQTQPKKNYNETEVKKPEVQVARKQVTRTVPDVVDDSAIIIKDRKFGDVSLFEEQDFGDYITKEEEELFLVTAPNKDKPNNTLLSTNNEILSPEKEEVNENLDDLLNLEPLPIISPPVEKTEEDAERKEPLKPVPKPRKKSLTKTEQEIPKKPEVMPRKVFLNKGEVSPNKITPPSIPPKPAEGHAKPKLPPKPKPPPKKPKPSTNMDNKNINLDAENANEPDRNVNGGLVSSSTDDLLKEMDILKYIEQEQKSLDSNLSLFD